MGALDEFGECIAREADAQGYDFEVCAEDGSYLYRTFRHGVVRTLTPGEFAKLLGIEWEWNGLSGGYDRAA
jgi:hypothetical protein